MTTEQALEIITTFRIHATDDDVREAMQIAKEALTWIPVSERLPSKITNKVNVLCKNGYIGFGHFERFGGTETWYNLESQKPFTDWDLENCETYEVTHWMPLPEPPKEEQ